MLSHPATMGSRVTAVKLNVACATRVASVMRIATVTNGPAMPNGAKPTRSTCAIGPTRSISLAGMYATTVLVPRMNIRAITGAAMNTDFRMDVAGERVSPARMAMYSKPPSAPNPILPSRFKFSRDISGIVMRNGWYSGSVPVSSPMIGNSSNAPKMVSMVTPPRLCTHFPTDSPIVDATTINDKMTADASATNHVLLVIHAAPGPSAYDRYVDACSPISDVNTITYNQRFHANMNPTV